MAISVSADDGAMIADLRLWPLFLAVLLTHSAASPSQLAIGTVKKAFGLIANSCASITIQNGRQRLIYLWPGVAAGRLKLKVAPRPWEPTAHKRPP